MRDNQGWTAAGHQAEETDCLDRVAEEYRGYGYDIVRAAQSPRLPTGEAQDQEAPPDGLVIAAEVKRRLDPDDLEALRSVKDAVERHPHWRFRLVIPTPPGPAPEPENDPMRLAERIAWARLLCAAGDNDAAVAMLAMAIEGCLHALAAARFGSPAADADCMVLARCLCDSGALEDEEISVLAPLWTARNLAARGFRSGLTLDVNDLAFAIAEKLAVEVGRQAPPATAQRDG